MVHKLPSPQNQPNQGSGPFYDAYQIAQTYNAQDPISYKLDVNQLLASRKGSTEAVDQPSNPNVYRGVSHNKVSFNQGKSSEDRHFHNDFRMG